MISDLGSDGVLGWAHMAFKLHCFFSNIVLGRETREEVMASTREFIARGKLSKCISISFIVLIFNEDGANVIMDSWPISLIGGIYKNFSGSFGN